jgi:hypothetical protein
MLSSAFEIACGYVSTGTRVDRHFWNIRGSGDGAEWIDLSWKQFPPGSTVLRHAILDHNASATAPRRASAARSCCGASSRTLPSGRPGSFLRSGPQPPGR